MTALYVLHQRLVDSACSMNKFAVACNDFGLTKRTEVLHLPSPNYDYNAPNIIVNGQLLNNVDKFTYFSSTLS